MNSLILQVVGRLLVTLMFLFSVFLLLRGHNEPGGGFVGGLMAVAGFGLYTLAYGIEAAKQALRFDPRTLLGLGLVLAVGSGLLAAFPGAPFLTGYWLEWRLSANYLLKVGTPTVFDLGVYFVVIGGTLAAVFSLEEA
ncbi:Na+/H+ antiporter subunit B [Truepera radiovictrix]|uniref:Multisubunit sodium/proton antiporter, MrpB subunit (2.A.63.1) n=1 Tax=Truepera radiovictrix (strain DSM 17093 / CIP 108686 / LMG 22925 / RQ-24) TaxID=649638 RepID=D7CUJ8_TRURR|nr:Na+/H+ antiporter subunit B [Truepera radiovictrix]ADI15783.1 multisubunit sodium/proton antiporter, MrpB subunit (2.A.63.1) [Truepera radiovictrix DSM 17093]WMT58590.1 Na+/H+ antiporter subunit B [Truepera radiovictrix]